MENTELSTEYLDNVLNQAIDLHHKQHESEKALAILEEAIKQIEVMSAYKNTDTTDKLSCVAPCEMAIYVVLYKPNGL